MLFKSRSLLIAAGLMAVPLGAAMAQQGNAPTNSSMNRASPTTGTATSTYGGAASMHNANPGATGHTVVPGDNSSQASNAPSTREEKAGNTTGAGGKN